uniref:Peroxisomal n-acetyl-spermine spermidine oxidase-like protein isoform x4 n=1 Tax=Triatoma infestans TaxID=30076 RepID=A0A161N0Y2_TRIIF
MIPAWKYPSFIHLANLKATSV